MKGECDDISELLVRMGVPWLARRIAVVSPPVPESDSSSGHSCLFNFCIWRCVFGLPAARYHSLLQGLEVQTIITQTEDTFITVESSSVGSFTKRLHTDGIFHPVEQWKNGIRPQSCIADPHKGLVCSWISFGSGQLVEVRRMLSRTRMEMVWLDPGMVEIRVQLRRDGFISSFLVSM